MRIRFVLPAENTTNEFAALPWPSELWRRPDGSLPWAIFPGHERLLLSTYVDAATQENAAYPLSPTLYFSFTNRPNIASLPADPSASRVPTSTVLLVDVDPTSPELGTMVPIRLRFYPEPLTLISANTLAVMPVPGFTLRPATLYAAVVQRSLGDPAGALLGTDADLERLKVRSNVPLDPYEPARQLHASAFDMLERHLGIRRADVAAMALFRTGTPTAALNALRRAFDAAEPPFFVGVVSAAWVATPRRSSFDMIRGYFCTPNFQSHLENAPFLDGKGGVFALDASGAPTAFPVPARWTVSECAGGLRARFTLTLPRKPMPAAGWPLLVVGHGTSGDADTFVGENDFAGWAAQAGFAAVSTDQPLHGPLGVPGARPGNRATFSLSFPGTSLPSGDSWPLLRPLTIRTEAAFYNPLYPAVARDNLRQAVADAMGLLRGLLRTDFATAVAANGGPLLAPPMAKAIAPRFDARTVLVAGHSQGCQSLAMQGAVDPRIRGVVLSGCGGDARLALRYRKRPDVTNLLTAILRLSPGELDEFHPFFALLQALLDPADPNAFGRYYREPLTGHPQNVLQVTGLGDSYMPPEAADALAVALSLTPLQPLRSPSVGLTLRDQAPAEGFLRGNGPQGASTRALLQLVPAQRKDGHFVVYDRPDAAETVVGWLQSARGNDFGTPLSATFRERMTTPELLPASRAHGGP